MNERRIKEKSDELLVRLVRQRVREANASKVSEADAWEQAGAQVVDLMARINGRKSS